MGSLEGRDGQSQVASSESHKSSEPWALPNLRPT